MKKGFRKILISFFLMIIFFININFVFAGIVNCGGKNVDDSLQKACTINDLFGTNPIAETTEIEFVETAATGMSSAAKAAAAANAAAIAKAAAANDPFWIKLINMALGISGIVILCIFIYSGINIMLFGSNPGKLKKSIASMKGSFIGILLVFFAFTIVKSFFAILVGNKWSIYFGQDYTTCTKNETDKTYCSNHGLRECDMVNGILNNVCKCDTPDYIGNRCSVLRPCVASDYNTDAYFDCDSSGKMIEIGAKITGKTCKGENNFRRVSDMPCPFKYCPTIGSYTDPTTDSYCNLKGKRECTSKHMLFYKCKCNLPYDGETCDTFVPCVNGDYNWTDNGICSSGGKLNQTGIKRTIECTGSSSVTKVGTTACEYCEEELENAPYCNSRGTRPCILPSFSYSNVCQCTLPYAGNKCETFVSCVDGDYNWTDNGICSSVGKLNQTGIKKTGIDCIASSAPAKVGTTSCEYCASDLENAPYCNSRGARLCALSTFFYKNECSCNGDDYSGDKCETLRTCTYADYDWANNGICDSSGKLNQIGTKITGKNCIDLPTLTKVGTTSCEYCTSDLENASYCNSRGTRPCISSTFSYNNECSCNETDYSGDKCEILRLCTSSDYLATDTNVCNGTLKKFNQTLTKNKTCNGPMSSSSVGTGSVCCTEPEDAVCTSKRCSLMYDTVNKCAPQSLSYKGSLKLPLGTGVKIENGNICGIGNAGRCIYVKQQYIDEVYFKSTWSINETIKKCDGRDEGGTIGIVGARSNSAFCVNDAGMYYCLRCIESSTYLKIQ